jgi:Icc-related predicted phosphoesterase
MKILQVMSLHGHPPFLDSVTQWSSQVDAIAVCGDMLPIASCRRRCDDEDRLYEWTKGLRCEVYWSPGIHDPHDLSKWDLPHLHGSGTHMQGGLSIHVLDTISVSLSLPRDLNLPGVVVSYYPPAATLCGVDTPSEEHHGRGDIRHFVSHLGDVRAALCGRVSKPKQRVDWCEGAIVAVPGMADYEHGEPAHCIMDLDRRSLSIYDGRRMFACSFARP